MRLEIDILLLLSRYLVSFWPIISFILFQELEVYIAQISYRFCLIPLLFLILLVFRL